MVRTFDLSDKKNYNVKFKKDLNFYTKEYVLLMKEILEYLNKYIETGNNRKLYIIIKCIESINHIFFIILLYTKNLSLTLYHCKKSFLYYIEFISQIGEEGNSYLQLNSKDAILFIYKKSIFDINSEYRENYEISEQDNTKIKEIKKLSIIFTNFYIYMINNIVFKEDNTVKDININLIKILDYLIKKNNSKNYLFEKIIKIQTFLETNNVENNTYIEILKILLRRKKILSKESENIEMSLSKKNLIKYLNVNNYKKFATYLLE